MKCLDKGFVRIISVMGDDSAVVQAARKSHASGTKSIERDRSLIRYLMRHRHTSPFEMCEIKFHIKLPIFVARQWLRHRTANVNEISGRYTVLTDDFYIPEEKVILGQSKDNKQGRSEIQGGGNSAEIIDSISKFSHCLYRILLKSCARELSRIVLPANIYTEMYWKIDLHNLFHFLKLRSSPDAQYEIREYANVISDMVKEKFPVCHEAFRDYVMEAETFSKHELKALRELLHTGSASFAGLTNREIKEFEKKITSE